METSTREVGIGKAKGERSEGRSWEEERGEGQKKETKKGEDNGDKESDRGVRDMG